ncbi:acyl-CoA dehydrogenase family protein, partial [Paracoccus sp. (in: a-proteobacteria)]|uniref:acyl-CoA dehydrogenase family protein n=1 Tax=Paracoccus sp. TaxID=267 RepID=UPI00289CC4B1
MNQEHVSFELGEDYMELRDSIRRICANYPMEYWANLEETSGYPTEFVAELTEGGFLAALIPEEYGGAGLPLRAAAVILEEINACGCQASPAHAQMYIMGTLLRHGTQAQKDRYLPEIAAGTLRLQAFGVTEPTTGSDTTQLKTRAVREGDDYVINGQKVFTSRALHSDLMLLLARTTPLDQVKKKTDGISVFLIDLRSARGNGVEIRPIKALMNHNTTEVFIENLRVPASALIGHEGDGFRYILDGMNA